MFAVAFVMMMMMMPLPMTGSPSLSPLFASVSVAAVVLDSVESVAHALASHADFADRDETGRRNRAAAVAENGAHQSQPEEQGIQRHERNCCYCCKCRRQHWNYGGIEVEAAVVVPVDLVQRLLLGLTCLAGDPPFFVGAILVGETI